MFRSWGKYDSVDFGSRYQVKRITVNPKARLSVQMHHHRVEYWVVVFGTAKVTNDDETFLVSGNESTYIPVGVIHALENPWKVPLELVEDQSGGFWEKMTLCVSKTTMGGLEITISHNPIDYNETNFFISSYVTFYADDK